MATVGFFNMARLLVNIFILLMLAGHVYAQLSPGELAKVHASLEGLSNCTQCHQLGEHIDGRKCLDCHQEIDLRIKSGNGFHAAVRDTNCIACHSDHNGRDFNMIRWPDEDMRQFDHDRTGFVLEGEKHKVAECRDCHQEKNVRAIDILDRKKDFLDHTFLGLSRACSSCHEDIHRGQFEQTCDVCHHVDDWKDVAQFSHDQARFALVGKHESVACEKCHVEEIGDSEASQTFTRFRPVSFGGCETCHVDVHQDLFEQTCEQCHSPNGWLDTTREQFNHTLTRFPLMGKHSGVNCQLCHGETQRVMRPTFGQCVDCHEDTHRGQFGHRADGGRCESCHLETGFIPAQFNLTMHHATRFPLEEAHQAVPCMMCHGKSEKDVVQFVWKQTDFVCQDCHQSPHGNQFSDRIAKEGCETCHSVASWYDVPIDHNATRFPLLGKHTGVSCEQCHKEVVTDTFSGRLYAPLSTQCQDCHTDQHGGQFVREEITACVRCHTSASWRADLFDHNKDSLFALTGGHEYVTCEKCHSEVVMDSGQKDRRYKPLDRTCASCHGEMRRE